MKNWLKLNNNFFIPNPEVQKILDYALIYNFWHLQCCSCKHQIFGIKNIFLEIIYHCLEILLHCSPYTVEFVSSQWTTFTSYITIIGKLFGLLILPEDCFPQRFDILKLYGNPTAFDYDLPHSGEVLSDFTPVSPAEVSQLLQSMSSKSSPLDYIPISLPKSCTDTFSILITHLANLSFTQAIFPSKFKLFSELHWLPVCHRINSQDCYYHFQISPVPAVILSRRSNSTVCANTIIAISSSLSLCVHNRKSGVEKSKSFSSVASSIWNELPGHLSSISTLPAFRKRLKHHLFWVPFLVIPQHPLASRFVMSAHPQMRLRSDTPHRRLANTFQLSAYD